MHKYLLAALPLFTPVLLAQGNLEVEPNNDALTATVLASGSQGYGAIDVAGDFDFYKVTLSAASDLRFWIGPGRVGTLDDSDLALLASDGTTVLATNDDVSGVTNWLSRIVAGNLPAGDYYLRVRSSQTFDPAGVGTYTIDVIAAAPGTYVGLSGPLTPAIEGAENNDPRPAYGSGVATVTALGTETLGNLSAAVGGTSFTGVGDYDFYEIFVPVAGMLTASTSVAGTIPAPAMTDTVVHIADASMTRLAYHDDVNYPANAFSTLNYAITTPGTYYIVVSGYDTGNYLLDITLAAPLPTGASTVTMQAGGCGVTLGNRACNQGDRPEVPVLGSAFFLDGAGMDANAPAFRVIGLGTLGSPFDLGSVGGPLGCNVEVDPISAVFFAADASGEDAWQLALPLDLGLIGLPLEQQLVALSGAQVIVASNRVTSVCGVTN